LKPLGFNRLASEQYLLNLKIQLIWITSKMELSLDSSR
jgi:hypothetical protein